ncbi:MAG: hypothetical protein QW589_04320 [Candidatus Bathyarchaeia archaeon]
MERFFEWAFRIGKEIINNQRYDKEKGKDLLKRLIFDIRAEETPGRFLEKLSGRITEYKTNTNIQANVYMHPEIMKREFYGDRFYYLKSAILTGFLNALSQEGE